MTRAVHSMLVEADVSETKWTKGPWKAEGPLRDSRTGTRAIEVGAETPDGHLSVAWVFGLNPGEDTKAAWADAHLIAAAPAMYEALAEVEREAEAVLAGQVEFDAETILATAQKAMALARGESPSPDATTEVKS